MKSKKINKVVANAGHMLINKFDTRGYEETAIGVGELSQTDVQAMLETLVADKNSKIIKLEVRLKQNGNYRVIANIIRV